jgi:aquaporin Z
MRAAAIRGGSAHASSGILAEGMLTYHFFMIVLGPTDARTPQGFAPIAIGLGLTLLHPIGIPVTKLSLNPARSTGPALFVGGWAIPQLWLFWVAPIAGALLAGLTCPALAGESGPPETRLAAASR